MANNLRAYDHLVLCVDDLERAREFYRKTGFTLTPVAIHPFGTHNSLVQLQGNFLEILALNDPSLIADHGARSFSFPAFNRDFLNTQEGFSMAVFQGKGASGDAAEFTAKGLGVYAPFDFSRTAKLPDGTQVRVSFSLAFATHKDMPEAAFFTCHQHNPEYFWKREYQAHENSAQAIVETMMVAKNPQQYADFFAKLLNSTTTINDHGVLSFALKGGSLSLFTPDQWHERFNNESPPDLTRGPRMAGYTIAVDDLEKTTYCLNKNDIDYVSLPTGIFISAKAAHGCVIEFTQTT
jgi:catechol 2,3-dioxygenase-like lactoylglutathione lyase family enzyme